MNNHQIYIISILEIDGYGLRQYLFECEEVEYYHEDRELILSQFWVATGLKPKDNKVVDVQKSPALSYSKSKLLS